LIYEQIIDIISKSSKIAVTSHMQPDGDNIGSSLALCLALKKLGKKAVFVIDDNVPELYRFLKGAREAEKPSSVAEIDFDLLIALDCGDLERLGKTAQLVSKTKLVNIDHHISNTKFGEMNLIEENASATAEIVYKLIKTMGIFIDKDIADCIYTGIVTDTGMFQYSNTSEETHSIAAELIIAGVSPSDIFNKVYQNSPKEKVLLLGEALKSLEFFNNDMVSCISISKAQVDNIAEEDIDTEGIVNLGRDIFGVEVAIFLKQKETNLVKVSLRSKTYIDVSIIAKDFGGGGHIRAAGCAVAGSLESVKQQILEAIQKQI
jgi:phosphoesterase RecJ-like protein